MEVKTMRKEPIANQQYNTTTPKQHKLAKCPICKQHHNNNKNNNTPTIKQQQLKQ
jgi:hypothetical protein